MMLHRYKKFYGDPLGVDSVSPAMEMECYLVFACRHKFCREICPVYQETGNEANVSYGFHTAVLAVARGAARLPELADSFTYCLECGGCELRCPNTLFAGDFYRRGTTTVDLVRKVRSDMVRAGHVYPGLDQVHTEVETHRRHVAGPSEAWTGWAADLGLRRGGKTVLFVDCFQARQTTEFPRAAARILQAVGVEFGILDQVWCTVEEAFDTGEADLIKNHGRKNTDALTAVGAETVILTDPHNYFLFKVDYPRFFGELPFEVVFITDYLLRLIRSGALKLTREINTRAAYHDPCTLNKLTGVWESPRALIQSVPGLRFLDEDHVSQWSYCCGHGVSGFKKLHPEISYRIGTKRLRRAVDLGADTLLLACPRCKDHLTETSKRSGLPIEFMDVVELVGKAAGVL